MLKFLRLRISVVIIGFSCEPAQPFLVDVDPQRIDSGNGDVDAQIELQVVDQQRVVDVVADDQRRVLLQFVVDSAHIPRYCDAFPLRSVVGLRDVGESRSAVDFLQQQGCFLRQDEGLGEEVEVRRAMSDLHLGDALIHEILPSEVETVGEVVEFLVGQERLVGLVLDDGGGPVDRPILVAVGVLEPVLVQQLLYQFDGAVLELVEIADFVVLGHIAELRKVIRWSYGLSLPMLFILPLPQRLDLLLDHIQPLPLVQVLPPGPRLEPEGFAGGSLDLGGHYISIERVPFLVGGLFVGGGEGREGAGAGVDDLDEFIQFELSLFFCLQHMFSL